MKSNKKKDKKIFNYDFASLYPSNYTIRLNPILSKRLRKLTSLSQKNSLNL